MAGEIMPLVLAAPDAVEAFVKACRAIQAYRNVENKHRQTMTEAIHYSRKLEYYVSFIDVRQQPQDGTNGTGEGENRAESGDVKNAIEAGVLEDSQVYLRDIFDNALLSMGTSQKVAEEWALRLQIDGKEKNRGRPFLARLTLSLLYRLSGSGKKVSQLNDVHDNGDFIKIGNQQIEDATRRLKHWLRDLHDVLLTSPLLHLRPPSGEASVYLEQDDLPDDIHFVAMARKRGAERRNMGLIDPELISETRPLESRRTNTFMLVESINSPYSGCLVDRRDIRHLIGKDGEKTPLDDTERIARLFAEERDELGRQIVASVGILPCCGFAKPELALHDLVFRLPTGTCRPRTLRSLLLEGEPHHSLNNRLDFSIKLVTTVLIIHSLKLLHKDIRPDSIIVVERISSSYAKDPSVRPLGEPYLVAFGDSTDFHSLDTPCYPSWTIRSSERRWRTLYTHPRHFASIDCPRYEMRDDIYSLGVCLLEVAIWRSLFLWDDERDMYLVDTSLCNLSEERYERLFKEMGKDTNSSASWLRQADLVRLAEERIPVTMGDAFRDVVVECLTFGMGKQSLAEILKEGEPSSVQIHMRDQSAAFIHHVLSKLRNLKIS